MKVKITESIDIADSAPHMPIVKVVKGETRDNLSAHVAKRLIELGCAEEVEEKPAKVKDKAEGKKPDDSGKSADEASTSEDNKSGTGGDKTEGSEDELSATPEATPESLKAELEAIALKEMDGPMGSEKKAKEVLEEIGKRYGIDVDKRKTVDGIIEAIVEAAFKE